MSEPEPEWLKFTRGYFPPATPAERRMNRIRSIIDAAIKRQTRAIVLAVTVNGLLIATVNFLLFKGLL